MNENENDNEIPPDMAGVAVDGWSCPCQWGCDFIIGRKLK